jgi:hypothetical protein
MLSIPDPHSRIPMTQKQAGIEQINLGFNEQQDRLLLKLGLTDKTEIVVWITRRICKAMWSLLQGTNAALLPTAGLMNQSPITTPEIKDQAIQSFEKEAAEQKIKDNMDFKSEYLTDRQTRTAEPLLAIQCIVVSVENQVPSLELQCLNGQSVKIALNNELTHAMINMVQLATREASWDLGFTPDSPQAMMAQSPSLIH